MQRLNYLTILTTIRKCVEIDRFYAGVFVKTCAKKAIVSKDIINSMDKEEQKTVCQSIISANNAVVMFKNGSYIKVLGMNVNTRGYAFHTVLYEEGIDREFLDCVIRPTEKLSLMNEGGYLYD